ncbi:hypothetical protein D3C87_125620 [compost metagenome]
MTKVYDYNSKAWDLQVQQSSPWTRPVTKEEIALARQGQWQVLLTNSTPVPRSWLEPLQGKRILGLASGGGQQGPIFAALGADVVILDASQAQLDQDVAVAEREGFNIKTYRGSMADLSVFGSESFDLVFNPASNCFIENVNPVWQEAARVLKKGGHLLSGFINPVYYACDQDLMDQGRVEFKYQIPFGDQKSRSEEAYKKYLETKAPLEFGHTLEDLLGGQLKAGLALVGMYEDHWGGLAIDKYLRTLMATRAVKL